MTVRPARALAALLAATVLVGVVAPASQAGAPITGSQRVRSTITLDTNLLSRSGASAWAIDEYLAARTSLPRLGSAFLAAEREHGVNARFLLAVAMHESGWGTSRISRVKRNLFGLNAYDRDPGRYASAFRSYAAGIDRTARFMRTAYLTPGGRWWTGRPTLRAMQRYWSSSGRWGEGVSRVARSIRLSTLSSRHIRFGAPGVRGRVHDGDRVAIRLRWTGGAIPAGIVFRATWVPVALDSADPAATNDRAAADPVVVKARRTSTAAHAITLAVVAPRQAGRYRLQVSMLDIGGQPLPRADRIAIPQADVRVWADRAVAVDLQPGPDHGGVTVRVTNTGSEAIPALPDWSPSAPHDSEADAERTVVSVSASADESGAGAVTLLAAPLVEALEPGATVSFDVPASGMAAVGAATWIGVDVRVADDAAFLARYLPVGAWHSGTGVGPVSRPVLASATGVPASITPTTPAAPAPAPAATPAPTPRPAATPSPTPAAPAATPDPAPTPAPVKHVTRTRGEHHGSIAYRGRWADAPYRGYLGGNVAWSNTSGAAATLTFTGSSVAWIGPLGPTRGRALILLDGRTVARVSLWRSSFTPRAVLFRKTFKATGEHTLTIRVLDSPGHPTVAIDGFTVRS